METSRIAKPYANALSALNSDKQSWLVLLKVAAALSNNKAIKALLASPKLAKKDKNKVIISLLEKVINKSLSNEQLRFVQLLIDYNRFAIASDIMQLFTQNATTSSAQIKISSAYNLTKSEVDGLNAKLKKQYSGDVSLNVKIKPNLLGGAVISSGDKVRDHSIRAKLAKLSVVLSSNK